MRFVSRTQNQFISHRVSVKPKLQIGSNELLIHFESAFLKGRDIEKAHEKLALWNGDSSRLHVRKAQYKCVDCGTIADDYLFLNGNTTLVTDGIGVCGLNL